MNKLYSGGTLGDMIVTALNRFRDRTAFICAERRITYQESAARISLAIQALKSMGLKKGDSVAQISRNRPEQWFVMAACYLAGFKSVSVHAMAGTEDHAYTIDDSDSVVVIYDPEFEPQVTRIRERCPGVRHWLIHSTEGDGFWQRASRFVPAALANESEPEDIIRLAYTGGTTGQSKGVMLSSRSMLQQALLGLVERDWPAVPVYVCPALISHGAGANIIPTLSRGGTFVLLPGFNASAVCDAILHLKGSVLYAVPTMLYTLIDYVRAHRPDISNLKLIMYGASPAAPARIQEALELFGPILCQNYGQSEAPSSIMVLRQCDHVADDLERLSSCGMPYSGVQVELLDNACNPVPKGETGEICVRGPIVMSGYWKKPELTEEALRGGWLHTGDLARQDAHGYYFIVGRSKDMIISGGFNVYPKEVENVISAHPAVAAAAVIGVPDPKWGEAVKAVIVVRDGATLDAEEIISLVREKKGPVYAPKSVDFVDKIPVTSLGKPDKAALKKKYWSDQVRSVN